MITPPSHRAILPIAPRPLPQPSPYPSPRSAEPMRRRNSFSYSFEDHARPPLRTAFSAAEGPGSGGGGLMLRMGSEEKEDFHDGWDGGDLTTKGRKRKRLAKACSACHVRSPLNDRHHSHLTKIHGGPLKSYSSHRRTNVDATGSPLAQTANSLPDHVSTSTPKAKRSHHPVRAIRPLRRGILARLS